MQHEIHDAAEESLRHVSPAATRGQRRLGLFDWLHGDHLRLLHGLLLLGWGVRRLRLHDGVRVLLRGVHLGVLLQRKGRRVHLGVVMRHLLLLLLLHGGALRLHLSCSLLLIHRLLLLLLLLVVGLLELLLW